VYDVRVQGLESMHLGAVDPENSKLLIPRLEHASRTIRHIRLPQHPNHPHDFVPHSICYPNQQGTTGEVKSMTTSNEASLATDVIYTNPELGLALIEDIIRRSLQSVLTSGFSVELRQGRQTPWVLPWYEDPLHPLVQAAVAEASTVTQHPVERRYGRGVADENILANWGIPMVLFPPRAQDEHTVTERGDASCVETTLVPFLHRMAGTERTLVNW